MIISWRVSGLVSAGGSVWLAGDPLAADADPLEVFVDPPQPEAAIVIVVAASATATILM
jgi:hypothetical protein